MDSTKYKTIFSLLIIILIILLAWSQFIIHLYYIYPQDWDFFLGQYEAIRRSILEFHQFPFWHPWHTGGTPLFAHLDIGVFSIDTLCVLVFGTVAGLKISIIIHLIIGAIGIYFLLSRYTQHEFIKLWGSLLFILQGTIAIHLSAGHLNMISIVWLPWIILLSNKIKSSLPKSLLLGFLLAVIANEGIHYIAIIILIIAAITVIKEALLNLKNKTFYFHLVLLILLFFSLSFYRLIISLALYFQYPREISNLTFVNPIRYLIGLLYPGQYNDSFQQFPLTTGSAEWLWHEFGCYMGIISFFMFFISLLKGIKWYHIGAVFTVLLAIDSTSPYLPGYWLRTLPIFKSMWVITRWRFFATFFIIIGSCVGMEMLYDYLKNKQKALKWIPYFLIFISISGLTYNQFYNWTKLEKYTTQQLFAPISHSSDTIITSNLSNPYGYVLNYPCVASGIGLMYSYENLLGYSTDYKSARIALEDKKNYKGEIFPIDKNSLDILWTPNRIFIKSKDKGRVWVNQNPGDYWFLNQQQLYPSYKAFEIEKPFIIYLPKAGDYILETEPPHNNIFIIINVFILAAFIILLFLHEKFYKKTK